MFKNNPNLKTTGINRIKTKTNKKVINKVKKSKLSTTKRNKNGLKLKLRNNNDNIDNISSSSLFSSSTLSTTSSTSFPFSTLSPTLSTTSTSSSNLITTTQRSFATTYQKLTPIKSLFQSTINKQQRQFSTLLLSNQFNNTSSLTTSTTSTTSPYQLSKRFNSTQQPISPTTSASDLSPDGKPRDPQLAITNFGLHPNLVDSLTNEFKITHLFPIQAEVMRPIQENQDLFGKSRTGTGKTLAFLLPMIDQIVKNNYQSPQRNTAPILILEPTRELALQVGRELEKLDPRIRIVTVYGGSSYDPQRQKLQQGCHICVATPGRLIDLADSGSIHLNETNRVVLDEADEMLRLGFQQNVENILQQCSPQRQTVLFSATLPSSIQSIVKRYTKNVKFIDCASGSEATPSLIKHKACMLPRQHEQIPQFVFSLFRMYSANGRAIVFSDTKAQASELETLLNNEAKNPNFCAALHGDVSQSARESILHRFREGRISMLLATDVAARGIDIPSVDLVVQLGIPRELESYVHRSGRTGRAGKTGTAVLCYRYNERDQMGSLSAQTGVRFAQVVREDLKTVDLDDNVIQLVQRTMGSNYTLNSKRYNDASNKLSTMNAEGGIDGEGNGTGDDVDHDPIFTAAVRITNQLVEKYDPKVLIANEVAKQLRERATGGSEGTPFSLLTSTALHTTIAFPPNENVASITRRLSQDLNIPTTQLRFLNQTFTQQAVLADIPDDIFNSIQPLIDSQTIDYIQVPRKLPSELFVGGQIGQKQRYGGGNSGGGNRNGGGNFGGNRGGNRDNNSYGGNRDNNSYGGNRDNNSYGGNRGGNNNYGGNRDHRGGNNNGYGGGNRGGYGGGNRGGYNNTGADAW